MRRIEMRYYKNFIVYVLLPLCVSCNIGNGGVEHLGEKELSWTISSMDSTLIKDDSTSWAGSYFSIGGKLGFLDEKTSSMSFYHWETGKCLKRVLDKGHAKNELPEWSVATAVVGDTSTVAIYANNFLFLYDVKEDKLTNEGFINFGYDKSQTTKDYESPAIYKICAMDIYRMDGNTLLFPLSHNGDDTKGWYENSHIWGCYNYRDKKFTSLAGHLPPYYEAHPVPLFERFASCKVKDKYLTTHVLDSMIYVHDNIEEVSHSFGYEVGGADRKYTCKENDMSDAFTAVKDEERITKNQSLLYSEGINCLLRTCVTGNVGNGKTTVQLYDMDTYNLVAEKEFPGALNFIHAEGNRFYGVNIMPQGVENYIYAFTVDK